MSSKFFFNPVPKDTQLSVLVGLLAVTILLGVIVVMPEGSAPDDQLIAFLPSVGATPGVHGQVKLAMAVAAMCVLLMLLHIVTLRWRNSHPLAALSREMQRVASMEPLPAGARLPSAADPFIEAMSTSFNRVLEQYEQKVEALRVRTQEMQDYQQEFLSVFDQSPSPMCMVATDATLIQANPAFAKLVGIPEDELLQMQFRDLFVADPSSDGVCAGLFHRGNGARSVEVKLNSRTSGVLRCLITTAVEYDANRSARYAIAHVMDVESIRKMDQMLQKANEQAREAQNARERFVVATGAELRAPLSPALMLATSLERDDNLPRSMRDDVVMIREYLEQIRSILDEATVSLATRETGLKFQMSPTSIHDVIHRAATTVESDLRRRRNELQMELTASSDVMVGDRDRLCDVMTAVIRAASAATGEDMPITVHTCNAAVDSLFIDVRVSGVAADDEATAELLTPLSVHDTSEQTTQLGFKLALARVTVEGHDGAISVSKDEKTHSLRFHIVLPVRAPVTASTQPTARRCLHLLVVDADEASLEAVRDVLMEHGHVVSAARTAARAMQLAGYKSYDLVISSIALPDMHGSELMQLLRDRYHARGIALVDSEADRAMARTTFDFQLSKPVRMNWLVDAVEHLSATADVPDSSSRFAQMRDAAYFGGTASAADS